MKRLRDILETADIIPFRSMIKANQKPSPALMTRQQVNSQLDAISDKNTGRWRHPELEAPHSKNHPITNIAQHIGTDPTKIYGDNINGINDFNRRKAIANKMYNQHREDIDTHVSDTLMNLQKLAANVETNKFDNPDGQTYAKKDVQASIQHWTTVKKQLGTYKSD